MQPSDIARAVDATTALAVSLGLTVDETIVVWNSNKLALRLVPCAVFARVAHSGQEVAELELDLARRLAAAGAPIAALAPEVEPRVHERDGFTITLWTYYVQLTSPPIAPADYAHALERLHVGMNGIDVIVPHFTDRITEAQAIVASPAGSPSVDETDRNSLSHALAGARQAVVERVGVEQLLHGEPHPGNVLNTTNGLRFIDLETCCRGPIEFDLAHVPEAVSECYASVDNELLRECRYLVLAMVAAWRCEPGDELPHREQALQELLSALRAGPPWEALDVVARRAGLP